MWLEIFESIIYELGLFIDCEMQAIDKMGFVFGCAKLFNFNLRYSWYSLSENLSLTASTLEILAILLGNPFKEK